MIVAASSEDVGFAHFIPREEGKDIIPHSLDIPEQLLSMIVGWQRKYFPSSFPKQLIWLGLYRLWCHCGGVKGSVSSHGGLSTSLSPSGGLGHHS